jgi:hypothetical protein
MTHIVILDGTANLVDSFDRDDEARAPGRFAGSSWKRKVAGRSWCSPRRSSSARRARRSRTPRPPRRQAGPRGLPGLLADRLACVGEGPIVLYRRSVIRLGPLLDRRALSHEASECSFDLGLAEIVTSRCSFSRVVTASNVTGMTT